MNNPMNRIRMLVISVLLLLTESLPLPAEELRVLDDFESRRWVNKLGGGAGAWEKFPLDTAEYCHATFADEPWNGAPNTVLRLQYSASDYDYNGYFSKLNGLDLRPYQGITFWIRGGREFRPQSVKVQVKTIFRTANCYVTGITDQWKKVYVPFSKFENFGDHNEWKRCSELVIVFEGQKVKSPGGVAYFDDIAFKASDEHYAKWSKKVNAENEAVRKELIRISELPEDQLLDYIERKTFDFFWYQVSPVTYLVKDRSTVTSCASTGATGFGLTGICIAVERKWISRKQAERRVIKTLEAIKNLVEGRNGFHYHWINHHNGRRDGTSEVGSVDDALMFGGVLTCREYFSNKKIKQLADDIFLAVDWPWMLGDDPTPGTLYMGWSPESGFGKFIRWDMFAEETMMYLMALGSPTFPLSEKSWHAFGRPVKDNEGYKYMYHDGESMFVYTYSHCWVDYRNKHDQYGDYWKNAQTAIKSNILFCRNNADKYRTYREGYWGISACDGPRAYAGYGAVYGMHDGTIPPYSMCAAVPYIPETAIPTIRKLLREYGPRVWGPYGFVSAFNLDQNWFAVEHIGIDMGVTMLMIENYRTGFVWKYFMRNPYIQEGMKKAGFKNGTKELDFAYLQDLQRKREKTEEARSMNAAKMTPQVDGDLSEWKGKLITYDSKKDLEFGEILSPEDLEGWFGMSWDSGNLYFAAEITDDKMLATENPAEIYRGDCIELYLDTKTKGKNFAWGDKEYYQIGLAPGCSLGRPIAYAWFQNGEQPGSIKMASKKTAKGYTIEVAIAAKFLNFELAAGKEIGMSPALHDLDKTEGGDKKLQWWFRKMAGRIQLGMVKLTE